MLRDIALMAATRLWRALDVGDVPAVWANEIAQEIERDDDYVLLRLNPWQSYWSTDASDYWFRVGAEAVEATSVDVIAGLQKEARWEAYQTAKKEATKTCDRENQWISGGDSVVFSLYTAPDAVACAYERGYEMQPYVDDPRFWRSVVDWYQGRVIKTPTAVGGAFTVRMEHGRHCSHKECCTDRGDWYEDGSVHAVEWTAILRIVEETNGRAEIE